MPILSALNGEKIRFFDWGYDTNGNIKHKILEVGSCGSCGHRLEDLQTCNNCNQPIDEIEVPKEALNLLHEMMTKSARSNRNARNRNVSKSLAPGFHKPSDLTQIFSLQDAKCFYCETALETEAGRKNYDLDHVQPISKTGTEWPDNLRYACKRCNSDKSDMIAGLFLRQLAKKNGPAWLEKRRKSHKLIAKEVKKLTKVRKQELAARLATLEKTIKKSLVDCGAQAEDYERDEVEVSFDEGGIKISVGDRFEISYPPYFHRHVDGWLRHENLLINSLIEMWRSASSFSGC